MKPTSSERGERTTSRSTVGSGAEATIFSLLAQVLRAYQLYGSSRPHSAHQIESLRQAFARVWKERPELEVSVGDSTLSVDDIVVYESAQRSESLAFLLYKESFRRLRFLPGFEIGEVDRFVGALHQSRYVRAEEDDLLTLLWEQDFVFLRYEHVEVGEAGGESEAAVANPGRGGPTGLAHVLAQELRTPAGAVAADVRPPGAATIDPEPLPASAHAVQDAAGIALGAEDAAVLAAEIDRERSRDLERDVVNALLDSFEQGTAEIRSEALQIFEHLVPRQIAEGDLATAVHSMRELGLLATQEGLPGPSQRELVRLLEQVAALCNRDEFWAQVDARREAPTAEEVLLLFAPLQGEALSLFLQRAEKTSRKPLRAVLEEAATQVAQSHPDVLSKLIPSAPPDLLRGALRLAARLGRNDLAAAAVPLLKHADPHLRHAAAECIVTLGTEAALRGLVGSLTDGAREVRLVAAWGIGAWAFAPAVECLESILAAPSFEVAPLNEKSALLVAYARAGRNRSCPLLSRLLNGRTRFWRKRPSEMRACVAHALGTLAEADARAALEKAARDRDAAVRTAAQRALDKAR